MKPNFKTLLGVTVGAVLSLDAAAALAQAPATRIAGGPAAAVRDLHRAHFEKVQMVDMVMHHCIAKGMEARDPGPEFGGMMEPGFDPAFMGLPGDMELLSVQVVAENEHGPLYQVSLRNNSRYCAKGFSVSLIAALGGLEFDSPIATINIQELGSGDVATVEVQLPAEALAMGSKHQPLVPFDTLFVAIDSFDELVETNELNNVTRLIRSEIAVITIEAAAPAQTEAFAPAPAGPEAEAAPGQALAPASQAAPAPKDEIDFDSLNFDASSAEAPVGSGPAQGETLEAAPGDASPAEGNGGANADGQGGVPNPLQPEAASLFISN